MIQSFSCKETERIWNGEFSKKFPTSIQQTAMRKLQLIHYAVSVSDLRNPPGNNLEKLSGNLQGFYSIRINIQWRIIFKWNQSSATDISIVDYH
jgi:proteic killer suppression protein